MDGVWLAFYYLDYGYHDVVPFLDELEARRFRDRHGEYLEVKFVPFGEELKW